MSARLHYDLPYRFVTPERVLVLGAGGGNDIAAALRAGARHVDAVEIDPVIVKYGALHPERPYSSPLVTTHVDDARSFLRRTDGLYDLIVLGLLDSHTLLAGLPGIRLDNYVYTREALADVKRHLSPRGLLALSFAIPDEREWLASKLYKLVGEAFGEAPVVLDVGYDRSYAYLAGPALKASGSEALAPLLPRVVSTERLLEIGKKEPVDIPTDDWPHLYLRNRMVPGAQLLLLALLLALSAGVTRAVLPFAGAPDVHMALLGAGFLLVETKAIADLGLLFGGTWWTVTAVIAAVLIMAILSTFFTARVKPRSRTPYAVGLFVMLLAGFVIRPATLLTFPLPVAQVMGALLVAAPVFFSGVLFATALKEATDTAKALGSNLLGSVLGGFLEYASLAWGVRALTLLGVALYGLALLALAERRER